MRPPISNPPVRPMMPMQNPITRMPYLDPNGNVGDQRFYNVNPAYWQVPITSPTPYGANAGAAMALLNRGGNTNIGLGPAAMGLGAPMYYPYEALTQATAYNGGGGPTELGYADALATVGNGRPMGRTPNTGTAYREWLVNNRQAPPAPAGARAGAQGAMRTTFQDRVAQQRAAAAMAQQAAMGNTRSAGDGTGMGRVGINGDATGMGNNAVAGPGRSTIQQRINARRGY